jgi:beta-mannosidase
VYFGAAKDLRLPDPGLQATLSADGHHLTVRATQLAREVWIGFGDHDARLSDNAFDLLPGESRTLEVTSPASVDALRTALQLRSLYGATKPATETLR